MLSRTTSAGLRSGRIVPLRLAYIARFVNVNIWQMAVRLTVGHGVNSVLILISLRSLVLSAKDSDGLFSMSDAVARIDSTNSQIRGTVTGTDQAWFVNFYSSFCGHCVRFAPVYKAFGRDVEGE